MTGPQVFSAEGPSASDRCRIWQSELRERMGLHVRQVSYPFTIARLEAARLNDVGFFRLSASSGYQVERTAYLASQDVKCLKLALCLSGTSTFQNGVDSIRLEAGEWAAFDNNRPYSSTSEGQVKLLVVTLPKRHFLGKNYELNILSMKKISGDRGLGQLTFQFLVSVFEELPSFSAKVNLPLIDVLTDMLHLAVREDEGLCVEAKPKTRLWLRIKEYIGGELQDPDLDVGRIARALGCTPRYLHKAFQLEGKSISRYILSLRLDRCRERLTRYQYQGESISDIAFSLGFNSTAHFSSAYRLRFRETPSQTRLLLKPKTEDLRLD